MKSFHFPLLKENLSTLYDALLKFQPEVTSDVQSVPAQTECGHPHCQTPQPVHLVGSHQAACDQLSSTRFEPAKQQQNTHVASVSMATPLVRRSHNRLEVTSRVLLELLDILLWQDPGVKKIHVMVVKI